MQARRIAGLLRVLTCMHSPLTTPSLASPVSPTHIAFFGCLGQAMLGAQRCILAPCKHAWRHHARPLLPPPAPTSVNRTPQRTNLALKSTPSGSDEASVQNTRLQARMPMSMHSCTLLPIPVPATHAQILVAFIARGNSASEWSHVLNEVLPQRKRAGACSAAARTSNLLAFVF